MLTEGFDPMNLLTDASKTAGWNAEGLPADPLSTQNASIIVKCARFPLIIDPQLQAIKWITDKESGDFKGCGFAEFASTEDADQAFLKQGQVLMSRPVRLDWAEDKPKKWEQ